MTVDVDLELVTGLVMVDRQRLAHHYSSRVLEFDPYLTDVFPAKEPLQADEHNCGPCASDATPAILPSTPPRA
jgi:hypothetical protein